MRKKFLCFLVAMMLVTGFGVIENVEAKTGQDSGIAINKENFGNAKSKFAVDMYAVAKRADTNEDGILSKKEIKATTKITVQVLPEVDEIDTDELEEEDYPIVFKKDDFKFDFKGIQYFTEVKEISIYQTFGDELADNSKAGKIKGYDSVFVNFELLYQLKKLEKLDISEADISEIDFSRFKKLKKVYLSCLYNLKTLEIQEGSKISNLTVDFCDKLESIDIAEKNVNLKNLSLEYLEKYETFDIKSKSLKKLYIGNCPKISTIEVNAVPKLKTLTVNNLSRLKSVDVSSLKKLKILNLMKLDNIKNVKFSKKQRIKDIYWENMPKIKALNCNLSQCTLLRLHNTGVKKINLKKAKKLDCLQLLYNKIRSVNLSNSKKINDITLSSKYLKKLVLAKGNKLEWLEWTDAGLKKFEVRNFNYESIISLNLKRNKLKKINVKKCKNLEYLDVDKNVKVIK